jgi:hypothetical protein
LTGSFEPLVAALLLAAVYLFGHRLLPWEEQHPRRWLSVASGASMAYVFLDVLPALGEHHRTIVEREHAEHRVYALALVGFVFLYALNEIAKGRRSVRLGWVHISGLALYGWVIGDALVSRDADGELSLWLYVAAMMFHLLVVTSAMAREDGTFYHSRGRWALAASILLGWGVAAFAPLPQAAMAYLYAFVAGGVLMTSANEELPREKNGRFGWFAMGAGAYGALLLVA